MPLYNGTDYAEVWTAYRVEGDPFDRGDFIGWNSLLCYQIVYNSFKLLSKIDT